MGVHDWVQIRQGARLQDRSSSAWLFNARTSRAILLGASIPVVVDASVDPTWSDE